MKDDTTVIEVVDCTQIEEINKEFKIIETLIEDTKYSLMISGITIQQILS